MTQIKLRESVEDYRKRLANESPTILSVLEKSLKDYNLYYEDIERVSANVFGKMKILNPNEARKILEKGKLVNCSRGIEEPYHNLQFRAYTKNRIFWLEIIDDETSEYGVRSIPRNPTREYE